MDEKLIAVLVGVAFGAVGYWFTTFWMKPILQYRELRTKILIDLIFYAQVVNAEGLNERMQRLYEERTLSNRKHSAELTACLLEIPCWYKFLLRMQGCKLETAAQDLMGFSNTTEYETAAQLVERIKAALGIKSESI
jgi:hypothetical protein